MNKKQRTIEFARPWKKGRVLEEIQIASHDKDAISPTRKGEPLEGFEQGSSAISLVPLEDLSDRRVGK